jgi:AcrR family transcriptional regulator
VSAQRGAGRRAAAPRKRRASAQRAAADGTQARLMAAARKLFAERGFHEVTVRDISREAGANLAAVGYHFGDKLNLYRSVVLAEVEALRRMHTPDAAPEGGSPEERIRNHVHSSLPRMVRPEAHMAWFQRLMRHEMARPTPLAKEIVALTYRPRVQRLAELVAELLRTTVDDPRVQHSVFSIQSQCMFYVRDSFRGLMFAQWSTETPEQIRAAADHIVDFSLAGIRALAQRSAGPETPRR